MCLLGWMWIYRLCLLGWMWICCNFKFKTVVAAYPHKSQQQQYNSHSFWTSPCNFKCEGVRLFHHMIHIVPSLTCVDRVCSEKCEYAAKQMWNCFGSILTLITAISGWSLSFFSLLHVIRCFCCCILPLITWVHNF